MYEVRRVGCPAHYAVLARAGKTSDGCDKGVGPGVLTCTVCRAKSAHGRESDSLGRHSTVTPSCLLRRRDMQHMSLRYFLLIAAVRSTQWWWSDGGGARRSSLHGILGMQRIPTR